MDNYYNHLAKLPALKARNMPKGLEGLAQALVRSGRFRVDTISRQNFVRWGRPFEGVNMMFSRRELEDKHLLPRTIATISKVFARKYSGEKLENKIAEEVARLQHDAKKSVEVSAETEIQLARLVVQSAEPPVIMLLLAEETEVFVSYSYSVGDMLDIQTWREAGDSSGLQSTEHSGCAVFVSCGGNPLVPEKKVENPNDGLYALRRMVVILGQELAHYSDIIREGRGRGSRFSADLRYGRASEKSRKGRLEDFSNVLNHKRSLQNMGLRYIAEAERALKFFREHRKFSLIVLKNKIKVYIYQCIFIIMCKMRGFNYLKPFYKEQYMCSQISLMLEDMLFNLHPEADAYKRPNPVEEEMIMCIEALARVQQQANKWGREVTKVMYPGLYHLYYMEILPSCINVIEQITGRPFPGVFKRRY